MERGLVSSPSYSGARYSKQENVDASEHEAAEEVAIVAQRGKCNHSPFFWPLLKQ